MIPFTPDTMPEAPPVPNEHSDGHVHTIQIRAIANKWLSRNFPQQRRHLSHTWPIANADDSWLVDVLVWMGKDSAKVGQLLIDHNSATLVDGTLQSVKDELSRYLDGEQPCQDVHDPLQGKLHEFRFGDGITGTEALADASVDLLLTDPPYGISTPYICEQQVPRRLRKDGRDFIMPRGHFGKWDNDFPSPSEWTEMVLPKVRGWAVVFCAQAQIGEYCAIFKGHGLVAVGPMVWQKTNPVPFNHTHKPINAWEAIVIGKRPGTPFNGRLVHNVFVCKSPSPQERIHSTQKPLPLIREFMGLFSRQGDLVLDPFAGSGTTVVAAVETERRVLAFENDPDSFNAAVQRINRLDVGLLFA